MRQTFIENLDGLPFPGYHCSLSARSIEWAERSSTDNKPRMWFIGVISAVLCACSAGLSYAFPKGVVDEMELLQKKYGETNSPSTTTLLR